MTQNKDKPENIHQSLSKEAAKTRQHGSPIKPLRTLKVRENSSRDVVEQKKSLEISGEIPPWDDDEENNCQC
jgi:hypothetical protein